MVKDKYIRWVVIGLSNLLLAVVVRPPKNRTSPVSEEALCLSLDGQLWTFALDVEHDDLANARRDKCIFVNG